MALQTRTSGISQTGELVDRHSDEGDADSPLTVNIPTGKTRRIMQVTVTYSAAVTQNVTATLKSGAGEACDNLLQTIAIAANRYGFWPPTEDIYLIEDDSLEVVAPAGGPGIKAAIAVYTKRL